MFNYLDIVLSFYTQSNIEQRSIVLPIYIISTMLIFSKKELYYMKIAS